MKKLLFAVLVGLSFTNVVAENVVDEFDWVMIDSNTTKRTFVIHDEINKIFMDVKNIQCANVDNGKVRITIEAIRDHDGNKEKIGTTLNSEFEVQQMFFVDKTFLLNYQYFCNLLNKGKLI